ncbi:hypothetical protein PINS_up016063 [Pythium insidiosum]|nr:hypothetical protein PINS_up016063 [Pythium insidiosum]
MVWGVIGWNGVGPLHFCDENVTAKYYVSMLDEVLPACATMLNLSEDVKMVQENAPAHKTK